MSLPARFLRRALQLALSATVALVVLAPLPTQAVPTDLRTHAQVLARTENGWVRGDATDEGRQFLGMAYAQAPSGDLRWKAPRPVKNWHGVKDATHYRNYCAQNAWYHPDYKEQHTTEDCLDVNVYTPSAATNVTRLPVMVFIHGGANIGGAGRDIVPDTFARRTNTVVVTLNYRLGALGFLTLPGTTGNFALLDQQAALRWVGANIGHFGGDHTKVTIAGESAGGGAVCAQLASPASHRLYRGAIIQSGAYFDCQGKTRETAVIDGLAFAAKLGCTKPATAADCLRAKPVKELLDAQSGGPETWNYTIGGRELPLQPADAFTTGRASRVPVINGANSNEGLVFAYDIFDRVGNPLTADAYPQALTSTFGEHTGTKALDHYALSSYERPVYAYAAAFGDQLFACPALRSNPRLAKRGPVYTYEFADRTSPPPTGIPAGTDFDFGATHATELAYLFKPFGHTPDFNAEQRTLAAQMTAYWGSFIHGSAPHAAGQQAMPEQGTRPGEVLQLRTASAGGNTSTTTLREVHHCDLWDAATSS
ncbi:carboxylesterase family protein [Streptomyces sp. NPDC093982]|uniref:carboxylesterase/lipase family protein n=1 Tax=Streptomyces sp. NPDC093982 TaxID=3155077 RepID=UPI00343EC2AD